MRASYPGASVLHTRSIKKLDIPIAGLSTRLIKILADRELPFSINLWLVKVLYGMEDLIVEVIPPLAMKTYKVLNKIHLVEVLLAFS